MFEPAAPPIEHGSLNDHALALQRSDPREALRLAQEASKQAARVGNSLEQGRALQTAGACQLELGHIDDAWKSLQAARTLLSDEQQDPAQQCELHRLLTRTCFLRNDYEQALRFCHEAVRLSDESDDVQVRADALNDAGMLYAQMGSFQQGLEYLLASLAVMERAGLPAGGKPLNNIGNIYLLQENAGKALEFFDLAMKAYEDSGGPRQVTIALANIGRAQEALGNLPAALRAHEQALEVVREADDLAYLPATLTKYGSVLTKLDRLGEALAAFEEAQELYADGATAFRDEFLLAKAELHVACRKAAEGLPLLEEALELGTASGDRDLRASAHRGLSKAFEQLGEWKKAFEHHRHFHELNLQILRELYSTHTQALLLHNEIDQSKREGRLLRDMNVKLSNAYEELQQLHQELAVKSRELEQQSIEDPLTKLFNRRYLEQRMEEELLHRESAGTTFSVIMADIDDFKRINDRYSHAVGDKILVQFANLLRSSTRRSDVVARVGGEEFVLLLPDTGVEDAGRVAEKLRQAVEDYPWYELGEDLRVTVSAGVSEAGVGDHAADVLMHADRELYRAKHLGKNAVFCEQGRVEALPNSPS